MTRLICARTDRHDSRLVCGRPLPCPWHTLTIEVENDLATVIEPPASDLSFREAERVVRVADALAKSGD